MRVLLYIALKCDSFLTVTSDMISIVSLSAREPNGIKHQEIARFRKVNISPTSLPVVRHVYGYAILTAEMTVEVATPHRYRSVLNQQIS